MSEARDCANDPVSSVLSSISFLYVFWYHWRFAVIVSTSPPLFWTTVLTSFEAIEAPAWMIATERAFAKFCAPCSSRLNFCVVSPMRRPMPSRLPTLIW